MIFSLWIFSCIFCVLFNKVFLSSNSWRYYSVLLSRSFIVCLLHLDLPSSENWFFYMDWGRVHVYLPYLLPKKCANIVSSSSLLCKTIFFIEHVYIYVLFLFIRLISLHISLQPISWNFLWFNHFTLNEDPIKNHLNDLCCFLWGFSCNFH